MFIYFSVEKKTRWLKAEYLLLPTKYLTSRNRILKCETKIQIVEPWMTEDTILNSTHLRPAPIPETMTRTTRLMNLNDMCISAG